jgi:hypothetical protein
MTEVKDTIPELEPRIIKGSRAKAALYLAGSLIFVLIGTQMVQDPKAGARLAARGVRGWLTYDRCAQAPYIRSSAAR